MEQRLPGSLRETVGEAAADMAGVAPESPLVIVKLARARAGGFPRTTELMRGLDYVIRKAQEYQNPHRCEYQLLEIPMDLMMAPRFWSGLFDDLANIWKSVICIGHRQ